MLHTNDLLYYSSIFHPIVPNSVDTATLGCHGNDLHGNEFVDTNMIFVDLLTYEKGEISDFIFCVGCLFLKWTLPKKVE